MNIFRHAETGSAAGVLRHTQSVCHQRMISTCQTSLFQHTKRGCGIPSTAAQPQKQPMHPIGQDKTLWANHSLPSFSKSRTARPFGKPIRKPEQIKTSPFGAKAVEKPQTAQKASENALDKSSTEKAAASETKVPAADPEPTAEPKKLRKFRPRKAAITLSPKAIEHLRALMDGPNPQLVRIGVKNRGCSGLTYHLEYVTEPGKFDETVAQDGVTVYIDSKALFSIIGSEMDWIDDKLSSRFVFNNPNIKGSCGCGESFMV